jgi:predicted glutamine amidotransferase
MCELLGLSANTPADIRFSFSGLKQRGGKTGIHVDGWGISLYDGRGSRSFHDLNPSAESDVAHLVQDAAIKSKIIISHIRQANRGRVCIENTHPFSRELWGCDWVFAHNGQLKGIKKKSLQFYNPIGTTDSEYAFCYMMDKIREEFPRPAKNKKDLWHLIRSLADEINQHGVFSFLLSDSRNMYAYCSNKMCWVTRQYPFNEAHYVDTGDTIDFNTYLSKDDVITVIASSALTDNEQWHCMEKGEFKVFNNGKPRRLAA